MRRLVFVIGVAVGYVLGTRAGRERYEQIAKAARGISQNPTVRKAGRSARDVGAAAVSKAGDQVADRVGDRLPTAVSQRLTAHRNNRADEEWGTSGWPDAGE
jgi:hypothetical protein